MFGCLSRVPRNLALLRPLSTARLMMRSVAAPVVPVVLSVPALRPVTASGTVAAIWAVLGLALGIGRAVVWLVPVRSQVGRRAVRLTGSGVVPVVAGRLGTSAAWVAARTVIINMGEPIGRHRVPAGTSVVSGVPVSMHPLIVRTVAVGTAIAGSLRAAPVRVVVIAGVTASLGIAVRLSVAVASPVAVRLSVAVAPTVAIVSGLARMRASWVPVVGRLPVSAGRVAADGTAYRAAANWRAAAPGAISPWSCVAGRRPVATRSVVCLTASGLTILAGRTAVPWLTTAAVLETASAVLRAESRISAIPLRPLSLLKSAGPTLTSR